MTNQSSLRDSVRIMGRIPRTEVLGYPRSSLRDANSTLASCPMSPLPSDPRPSAFISVHQRRIVVFALCKLQIANHKCPCPTSLTRPSQTLYTESVTSRWECPSCTQLPCAALERIGECYLFRKLPAQNHPPKSPSYLGLFC